MTSASRGSTQAAADWRAYFLLTFTAFCWGANAVFGKLAVGQLSPMVLVTLRWSFVLLVLTPFAIRQIRRDWPELKTRLRLLFAMGGLGFTAFNALFYVAAHSTTALNIGILQGSIPVFVLVGAFAAYGARVTALQLAGVAITICGVFVVATGGNLSRLADLGLNKGDVLMIFACTLYAGYAVGLQKRPNVSSLSLFAVLAAAAFLTSLPLIVLEGAVGQLSWPTPYGWVVVLLVTIFPSLIAQIFFIQGVAMIGPGRAGVFVNLVPVFAAILAVAILKESFEAFHATALTLVLAGIWLSEHGRRKPR